MRSDFKIKVGKTELESPVITASGVWPYEEDFWKGDRLEGIGAICTKAISLLPRTGNRGIRLWETPAGMLNSIGLQNTGVDGFVSSYSKLVKISPVPVIANVVMESAEDTSRTLYKLSKIDGLAAVELNISCPNVDDDGMMWGMNPSSAAEAVRAARSAWKGELWVKMTPQTQYPVEVARAIETEGADAIVAANTWLGMGMDMEKGRPAFDRVVAGLSGPAIFPLALRLVWQISEATDIPVIGCGGVSSASDCAAMMLAGASAVEIGTAFFKNMNIGKEIREDLGTYIDLYGCTRLENIIGLAKKRA